MNPNALMKLGMNALAKTRTSALSNIVRDATTKALTKGLTGAGISTLAKGAGSTLDGLLGRSSGLVLPNATKPATISLAEQYADTPLAKTAQQEISEIANRNSKLLAELDDDGDISYDVAGDIATGEAPSFRKDDEVYNKLRKIAKDQNVSTFADSENQMIDYAKLSPIERSDILDGLLNKENTLVPDYVLEDYAGTKLEPEGLISENQLRLIDQETAPKEMKIEVEKPRTRKKNIDVALGNKEAKLEKPKATMGVEKAVAETPTTTNPELSNQIAELKAQVSSAGGGMKGGGGTPTATGSPEYGGLGDSGFNVRLKDGKTTNVPLQNSASGSTKQQRAIRKLDDMSAKNMNASAKQYKGLVGKSGSIDGHYKTVAERIRAEKIDQANVAEKAQAALSLREEIKQQGLQYAEANGVAIDLSNIDKLVGLSPTQKRKLAELGLGLDDMLGSQKIVSPTQAEEIYKILRQYGYDWEDSKDALTNMAGKAMKKEAEAVRDIIDKTMDNINVDYKTSLIEDAAKNGEDPAYLRKLAGKSDFKFSDLRKDQSDWITINDLAGNKIKEGPTLNVFGVDTGATNPFTAGAEKIKEKIYERQAYGAGGGNSGGGSVPPLGSSGAENNINFETIGERSGALGNLLGRAKGAGLVGAGLLGGLLLGGGGSGGGAGDFSTMGNNMLGTASKEPETDLYNSLTIGGYTYQELEDGYFRAVQAGDNSAAKLIANMMGMLDDKVKRYQNAKENSSSGSGVGGKQRAALNVLSSLMGNYQAQGPIGGRFTQLMNALTGGGYAPGIAAYDSGAQGSLGIVIKALHDTGALSEGDQKRALELLPKTTDNEQAAKMKYQQLIQILQGAGTQ